MASRQEQKVIEGAAPFLEDGEEVLAAIVARPRGWTQATAGSGVLGGRQQRNARAGADAAGFELASPMGLAVTQRRLLSLKLGTALGMGAGGAVDGLAGAAPLGDVDKLESKRLLLGKVVTVSVRGQAFKLEVNAKADVNGLVEAFARASATA